MITYDWAPVLLEHEQSKYREKSVTIAAMIIIIVAGIIPAFSKLSGTDSTPPPT